VNTYDPADDIVYVHLARETDPCPTSPDEGRGCARVPTGYANESPSTALRQPRSPDAEACADVSFPAFDPDPVKPGSHRAAAVRSDSPTPPDASTRPHPERPGPVPKPERRSIDNDTRTQSSNWTEPPLIGPNRHAEDSTDACEASWRPGDASAAPPPPQPASRTAVSTEDVRTERYITGLSGSRATVRIHRHLDDHVRPCAKTGTQRNPRDDVLPSGHARRQAIAPSPAQRNCSAGDVVAQQVRLHLASGGLRQFPIDVSFRHLECR